jgi:hypothetical protein
MFHFFLSFWHVSMHICLLAGICKPKCVTEHSVALTATHSYGVWLSAGPPQKKSNRREQILTKALVSLIIGHYLCKLIPTFVSCILIHLELQACYFAHPLVTCSLC